MHLPHRSGLADSPSTFQLLNSNGHEVPLGQNGIINSSIYIGAVACDFQQFDILTSVDSDEPVQHPFKPRNSKWCSVSSLTVIEYSSD